MFGSWLSLFFSTSFWEMEFHMNVVICWKKYSCLDSKWVFTINFENVCGYLSINFHGIQIHVTKSYWFSKFVWLKLTKQNGRFLTMAVFLLQMRFELLPGLAGHNFEILHSQWSSRNLRRKTRRVSIKRIRTNLEL